jgi:hypothetical protein
MQSLMDKKNIFHTLLKPFVRNKSEKVNFLEKHEAKELLDMLSKGNTGAMFLAIGKHTKVAEKIAIDLYTSGDETNKCYAAQLLGYIEDSKSNLFISLYRSEKQYFDSMAADDVRRENCHRVIEDLIISTVVQFDLKFQRYQNRRSSARTGSDWINCLFEIVSDAVNGYQWNGFRWALVVLSFHYYPKKWFKVLLTGYEEYISRTTGDMTQTDRDLYQELTAKNGETEMFIGFLNDMVMPKIDAAGNYILGHDEENLIAQMIKYF